MIIDNLAFTNKETGAADPVAVPTGGYVRGLPPSHKAMADKRELVGIITYF